MVLFGGNGNGFLNDTWTFDGTSWTQVSVASYPPKRDFAMMTALGNEVVLFGGQTNTAGSPIFLSDTWTFDGSNWTEVPVSNAPPARASAPMATLGNEVVLFGGVTGSDLNDTWTFDGSNWTQVSVSNAPPPRARDYAVMTILP